MKKQLWIISLMIAAVLTACAPGQQQLTLEATDIKYDLTTLTVTANQPAKLTFKNTGALEHDFTIMKIPVTKVREIGEHTHTMNLPEEPELHIGVVGGTSAEVEFTATAPGEYDYFCTVPGHKEAGMVGKMIVK